MNIDFLKIELKNFMSFEHESFDFNAFPGMTLVQGKNNDIPGSKNGSGKSQLWNSLLYALFGQLQTKIKNENLLNRNVDSNEMEVAVLLSVDKKVYKICRGMAGKKSSYLSIFSADASTGESVDDLTKSTIAETQKFIEEDMLHCDITMFLRTILLTADQTYNFYMLKKADKKEFVEKLFDISVFEDMYKAIHKDSLTVDKELVACNNRLFMLNKNQADYNVRKNAFEKNRDNNVKSIEKAIEDVARQLSEAREKAVESNSSSIDKLVEAIDQLRAKHSTIDESLRKRQQSLYSVESKISKIDGSIDIRKQAILKHKDILTKLCSDCKTVFMQHYSLDKMANEMSTLKNEKTALLESKKTVEDAIVDDKTAADAIKAKIDKAHARLKEMAEESNKANRRIMQLESSLAEENKRLAKAKTETNPYDELVESCHRDIENETKQLNSLDMKLRYLKFAEGIVSQDTLRKFIIKDLIVLLNNKIKTYLTKLGAKYYVEFDENMDYEFITNAGTFEWSNFSAGERMRIMIATSFAFRDFMSIRNGLNANLLVLDEYFDSAIDSLCVENIIDILKDYSTKLHQNVFVISHRPETNVDKFDRTIVVEKTNGISHVCA